MHRIADPQISPSGKWVLFSVTDVSLEKNTRTNHLWLVPIAGGKEVQLTTASGESNGRFSPNGKWISFTQSDQIWLAPFNDATGSLGDGHQATALTTGADGAIWAPDSAHILFTSSVYPGCESKAPAGPIHNDEEATATPSATPSPTSPPSKPRSLTPSSTDTGTPTPAPNTPTSSTPTSPLAPTSPPPTSPPPASSATTKPPPSPSAAH